MACATMTMQDIGMCRYDYLVCRAHPCAAPIAPTDFVLLSNGEAQEFKKVYI